MTTPCGQLGPPRMQHRKADAQQECDDPDDVERPHRDQRIDRSDETARTSDDREYLQDGRKSEQTETREEQREREPEVPLRHSIELEHIAHARTESVREIRAGNDVEERKSPVLEAPLADRRRAQRVRGEHQRNLQADQCDDKWEGFVTGTPLATGASGGEEEHDDQCRHTECEQGVVQPARTTRIDVFVEEVRARPGADHERQRQRSNRHRHRDGLQAAATPPDLVQTPTQRKHEGDERDQIDDVGHLKSPHSQPL